MTPGYLQQQGATVLPQLPPHPHGSKRTPRAVLQQATVNQPEAIPYIGIKAGQLRSSLAQELSSTREPNLRSRILLSVFRRPWLVRDDSLEMLRESTEVGDILTAAQFQKHIHSFATPRSTFRCPVAGSHPQHGPTAHCPVPTATSEVSDRERLPYGMTSQHKSSAALYQGEATKQHSPQRAC
ncbi:hypothetical protein SS50377_25982 [Spironucleus salmonicida]|uniref:Uncharacterized protein n=1 Tax=Spironucleus salmonicida TaxID=348837 RepID=A0A9P8LPH9_9EUKA|nr:hypothetical protein SS50377_25982 [Spironucleus salmonicida]